jgi:hypothetical protein
VGKGADVALATTRALRSVRATALGLRASDFDGLTTDEVASIQRKLSDTSNLEPLLLAIHPLFSLYPTFPLRGLFSDAGTDDPAGKGRLTMAVGSLLDRRSREATFVQATAVYVAAMSGSVKLMKIPGVDLNTVKDFPRTDESRVTASFVRSTISAILPDKEVPAHRWPIEFWNHGYDIDACAVAAT